MSGTNGNHSQQTLEYRDAVDIPRDDEPTSAPDAEVALLGAVVIDPDLLLQLRTRIDPDDFTVAAHRAAWSALVALFDAKQPIDYVTLVETAEHAARAESLPAPFTASRVAQWCEFVPTSAHGLRYAATVREARNRRELVQLGAELVHSGEQDIAETTDRVREVLARVEDRVTEAHPSRTVHSVMRDVFRKLDEFGQRPAGTLPGLASGFIELDELTGGFRPGEMIVLAARASMGKTTCATSIIRHVALNEQLPVLFFSCEMSGEQIVQNSLCAEARINSKRLRSGYLDEYEYDRLVDASKRLDAAPWIINDTPAVTLTAIRTAALRAKRQGKLALLVIDYLQILGTRGLVLNRKDGREREVAALSAGLKALGRELEVPVIVLAQLNRDVEKRTGSHKPRMSDLRESGSIENDADVILLLHREHYYTRNDEDREKAELIVAKQRNGPTGTAHLRFRAEFMRFDNPEDDHAPPPREPAKFREVRPAGAHGFGGNSHSAAVDAARTGEREYDEDEAPFDYDDGAAPPLV